LGEARLAQRGTAHCTVAVGGSLRAWPPQVGFDIGKACLAIDDDLFAEAMAEFDR